LSLKILDAAVKLDVLFTQLFVAVGDVVIFKTSKLLERLKFSGVW
jgi:hypothetical protein